MYVHVQLVSMTGGSKCTTANTVCKCTLPFMYNTNMSDGAIFKHRTYRMRFHFCGVYISRICNFRVFKFAFAGHSGVEILYSIRQLQRCTTCWTRCWIRLKMSLNGELHLRISHLQGGMDAFHWRKAWLGPGKKQQRRSVRCCNEERD